MGTIKQLKIKYKDSITTDARKLINTIKYEANKFFSSSISKYI